MIKKEFLSELIKRSCEIYFKEIDPNKISIKFTKSNQKFKGKRRVMGIYSITKNKIVIQIDNEYFKKADPGSLVEKLAHELAHIKFWIIDRSSWSNEKKMIKEVKKFSKFLKKHDKQLMKIIYPKGPRSSVD